MNLLTILEQHTQHINLNDIEPMKRYSFNSFENLFEYMNKYNITLTRTLTQHERDVLLSHAFILPRTAKHIALLEYQKLTPEMLYAILDYLKLRQGKQTSMKINAYFKRTMTSDVLILATLYHMKNDNHIDIRMYNAIVIAINLLNMPMNEIVKHILSDNLVETVDEIIADKKYKRMSNATLIKHLLKYVYNFDMSQKQFNNIQPAASANFHLLALILNNEIKYPENINHVLNNDFAVNALKPLYDVD